MASLFVFLVHRNKDTIISAQLKLRPVCRQLGRGVAGFRTGWGTFQPALQLFQPIHIAMLFTVLYLLTMNLWPGLVQSSNPQ